MVAVKVSAAVALAAAILLPQTAVAPLVIGIAARAATALSTRSRVTPWRSRWARMIELTWS